jgi:signal transduction histidine kinase
MALPADLKGLEVTRDVQTDVPDALRADVGRLRQVLVNLVGNAIQFTHAGEVAMTVRVEQQDSTEATMRVSIRDTGNQYS